MNEQKEGLVLYLFYDLGGDFGCLTSLGNGYKDYCILYLNYSAIDHNEKNIVPDRFKYIYFSKLVWLRLYTLDFTISTQVQV